MALSSNKKYGALLAALLPIAASVYQEGQNQRARTEQQLERQRAEDQLKADSNRAADAALAQTLQKSLQDALNEVDTSGHAVDAESMRLKLCQQIYFGASQLQVHPAAEMTNVTLLAALNFRKQDGTRAACMCGAKFFDNIQDEWNFQGKSSPSARALAHDRASLLLNDRFLAGLRSADNDCAPRPAGVDIVAVQHPAPSSDNIMVQAEASAVPPPLASAACEIRKIAQPSGRVLVYIQISDETQRAAAAQLQRGLNAQPPFAATGIQNVGTARAPNKAEVRYFYDDDADVADTLSKSLNASGGNCGLAVTDLQAKQLPQFQGRVAHGVLEVWFPKNSNGGKGA